MIKINKIAAVFLAVLVLWQLSAYAESALPAISASELGASGTAIPEFDLTRDGASAISYGSSFTFTPLGGESGCYQITANPSTPGYTEVMSRRTFPADGNRTYRLSMLVNTDLTKDSCEVSVGFAFTNSEGQKLCHTTSGLPVNTGGKWQRYTYDFTAPAVSGANARAYLLFSDAAFDKGNTNLCYISDLRVEELAPASLVPLSPGESMVFGGSSGKLGMKIEEVTDSGSSITVKTSGTIFEFDKSGSAVTGTQLINKKRDVVTAAFSKPLNSLSVLSQSQNEVVLTTGENGVTFGVQMDGMMLISNHGSTPLTVTCTSEIAGEWSRLAYGHLLSMDKIGGFTVNPSIPQGTGRLPVYETVGELDFNGKYRDTTFLSSEEAGWQAKWTVASGELLGVSVFPPRKMSFEDVVLNRGILGDIGGDPDVYTEYEYMNNKYGINTTTLWTFSQRGYGMSNSSQCTPKNEYKYIRNIEEAKKAGVTPITYFSFYFYYNRNVDEYIAEATRHRDEYGISGIYTDGLPASEWLASYECMRRMRGVFPDGTISLHATGISENGGPPLSAPDIFIPAVECYADSFLRGEDIAYEGVDWIYPSYCCNGSFTNGAVGRMKSNKWKDDGGAVLSDVDSAMITMMMGCAPGVSRGEVLGTLKPETINVMEGLLTYRRAVGMDKYEESDAYNGLMRRLAREYISSAVDAAEAVIEDAFSNLSDSWMIKSTSDSSVYTDSGRLVLADGGDGRCSAARSFDEQRGLLHLQFGIRADGKGARFVHMGKGKSNAVSLMIFNGKLYVFGAKKGYEELCGMPEGVRCEISVSADAAAQRFSISVNGIEQADNIPFEKTAYAIDNISFSTDYGSVGNTFIDTLLLETKF